MPAWLPGPASRIMLLPPMLLPLRRTAYGVASKARRRMATDGVAACFTSDNCRGALPEVMDALARANSQPHVPSYGADSYTAAAVDAVRAWLDAPDAHVLPTISGIASDALAIAHFAGATASASVYCHEHSHIQVSGHVACL
jgi:hypothetical protein